MSRLLIENAVACQHSNDWVSEMGSSRLDRPSFRPKHLDGVGRKAAVMLLAFPADHGHVYSILTRRKDTLQHHPGQVSLPGGRMDEEETLEQTALREVEEELGVDRSLIEVVGKLNQIYIPPSDFTVTPFVGWLTAEPTYTIQAEEVDELIRFPLNSLFNKSIRRNSSVDSDQKERDVPWFSIMNHQVWGATAMILDDFAERLRQVWID